MPDFEIIRKRAADFLCGEKSEQWSFNYWARSSEERKTMPYPDDLDDTFVALAAIYSYDPNRITGEALAKIAKLMLSTETAPGGPYKTWLTTNSAGSECQYIDIAVNSNIGYFLSLLNISLSNLKKFVSGRIQEKDIHSCYYSTGIQPAYFISRFYSGEESARLAEIILKERGKDQIWANPLESAMAISALLNLGFRNQISEKTLKIFIGSIEQNGWGPCAFCVDPSRDGKRYYAGSIALTAAFCAEMLARWMALSKKIKREEVDACNPESALQKVKEMACDEVERLPRALKQAALQEITKRYDPEVVMVPYLIQKALNERAKNISKSTLDALALANLYGWIAYGVYDDILDREGAPPLILVANVFLRELTLIYADLEKEIPGIMLWFRCLMNGVDGANPQEADIEHLADRSLAHALPAIAILLKIGFKTDAPEVVSILSFFRNYLIARQLNDDAHDWCDDLARGRITPVCARFISAWGKVNGDFVFNSRDFLEYRKFFWRQIIEGIVNDIQKFLTYARHDLISISILETAAPLEALLTRLESIANKTIREREQAMAFLNAYRK